ncbi:hypothetical protein B0H21DRAFT_756891 [Amylocystis lapponica]|nr:hypothetical protein B0H21DRAFT_756891 [Amylocystis lapponica]
MAVSISSHRIHTIHGSFSDTSPSSGALAVQASSFTKLPNISLSSSRGQGLSILAARTASASAAYTSAPRRSPVRIPTSSRRAPPPPPRPAASCTEDPFCDDSCEITSLPPPPRTARSAHTPIISSRTRLSSYTASPPPGLQSASAEKSDRTTARGRLVASVLLSRRCGRPARRRPGSLGAGERPYVKSGLSRVVAVDA